MNEIYKEKKEQEKIYKKYTKQIEFARAKDNKQRQRTDKSVSPVEKLNMLFEREGI